MTSTERLTLAEFILTRIAEDEAVARGIHDDAEPGFGRWNFRGGESLYNELDGVFATGPWGGGIDQEFGLHIARWDPARKLAECEAKRRIVELHTDGNADARWDPTDDTLPAFCTVCEDRSAHDAADWPCLTLRLLALPYAVHPDYSESWRP